MYIHLAVAPVRQPALRPTIAKRLARQRADLTGNVRRRTPAAGLPRPGRAKADAQARSGVSRACSLGAHRRRSARGREGRMRDQLTPARATQMTGMCDRDLAPVLADLPSVWAERSEGVLRIMGGSTVAPLSPPRCALDAPRAPTSSASFSVESTAMPLTDIGDRDLSPTSTHHAAVNRSTGVRSTSFVAYAPQKRSGPCDTARSIVMDDHSPCTRFAIAV
jgi:hypothetical protein